MDFLPEIRKEPNILCHFTAILQFYGLKSDVDQFLATKNITLLETIRMKLFLHKKDSLDRDTKYNGPLLNSLLLYLGMNLPLHGDRAGTDHNPSLEILVYLAHNLDAEGRYLFLSVLANHLR